MSEFKQLPIKVHNYLSSEIDRYKEAKEAYAQNPSLDNLSKMLALKRNIQFIKRIIDEYKIE